ncbi:CubicO group peptidase (beta-lactamase class C family) [Flavobacterium nitrogenifigens]|uniref:CubicO group peptidase (Beta-lactamase class C family) n=2 Tax=Flavobacterium TaxID=237 RepID=A0A7W7IWP4_9FLAO|nr:MULTISPECIES: serine hydrolase domain-containing protein [Flavobacterium]MBB4801971.1 CubicO group peptidase (beta-lactamase class C family) [Flavobacterium nitrogenifigens]MBB6386929.1 CubicO group peptidase (beta-lactamase class C family) [Flavobacterium notoginsengisoli]
MNSIFKFSSFLSLLLIFSSCQSSAQKKDDYKKSIDSLVQNTNPTFNGVVLVSQNGKTLYSKVKGYSNFETKKPLKIDTQFEIMSNSKLIAAVLLLLEVEKGKVDLNAPIKKYLPELKQTWADSVTVHQLLNHSHGIVDLQKPLIFKPGTDFKYGNLSFNLVGKIVEFSSKKSYREVAESLFKKLKMNHTFCYSKDKEQNLATGYYNINNQFKPDTSRQINDETLGGDGIISTVSDLAIWNNNLHKGKILKPESYKLLTKNTILSQHNFFGKEKDGYGYGIRVIEKELYKYLGHTGLGDGFSSVNLYFPESDISLIVLENQMPEDSKLFYASEFKIKNILFKSDLLNKK